MRQPWLLGSAYKGIGIVRHLGLAPKQAPDPVENVTQASMWRTLRQCTSPSSSDHIVNHGRRAELSYFP
jgi:hypothetical protein